MLAPAMVKKGKLSEEDLNVLKTLVNSMNSMSCFLQIEKRNLTNSSAWFTEGIIPEDIKQMINDVLESRTRLVL